MLWRAATNSRTRQTSSALVSANGNNSSTVQSSYQYSRTQSFSQLVDPWRVLQDETDLLLAAPGDSEVFISDDDMSSVLSRWQSHPNAQLAAETCHKLLNHWLSSSQNHINTSEPFLLTMKAWNRVGEAFRAADVLQEWVQLLEDDLELAPTREAYHVLLEAFAKQGVIESSLSLLEYLERMKSMGSLTLQPPNVETYAHVVACLTQNLNEKSEERWNKIQSLMVKLERVHRRLPQDIYYRLQAYSNVVLFAVSIGEKDKAVTLLQNEIHQRELVVAAMYWEEYMKGDRSSSPAYLVGRASQSVLYRMWESKEAVQMDELLVWLEEYSPDSGLPWPQHYTMTIEAWGHTCTNDRDESFILQAASRCEELLRHMEERHFAADSDKPLNLRMYKQVLWMYSRAKRPAEYLLAHVMNLLDQHADKVTIPEPTLTEAWNHVLESFRLSERPDKVLQLWERMKGMNIQQNDSTLHVVLKALSRSLQPNAAQQAEYVFRNMDTEKSAAHFEPVIMAWCRSSDQDAIASAQALLVELEELYDAAEERREKLRPTISMYNAIISAFARRRKQEAAEKVLDHMMKRADVDNDCPLPDSVSFAALLDCLSRQGSRTAARKAEELLTLMESNDDVRPQQSSYTSVMSAIVRSKDNEAPERVMRVYKRMLAASQSGSERSDTLRPDVVTYGLLLDMWAKSRRDEGGKNAERVLREMQQNDMKPNLVNYNNVILAHARSKRADSFDRAKDLLREMEERTRDDDESVRPNTVTYSNVIMALKRSRIENKAQEAWDLLQEMALSYSDGDNDVRPNVITVNAVLTACAFTRGSDETRQQAVKLALAVFSEMERFGIAPNSNSFRLLFETFGRQVPDLAERTKMAEVALQRCRRDGLVDEIIVEALQMYVPPLYDRIASSLGIPKNGRQVDRTRQRPST